MSLENIEHVFVLMMENHSFDQMLGFSNIGGTDAVNGGQTTAEGLPPNGGVNYDANNAPYQTASPAPYMMPADPNHEFPDVQLQLLGTNAPTANYHNTNIKNSGFVLSYAHTAGSNPLGGVMACFDPTQVPVITALANEFCVCDHWFSSLPGPTVPNRFFLHAATSGGDPTSPNTLTLVRAVLDGSASYKFANGNIFQRLTQKNIPWGIYHGDTFAMVYALDGVSFGAGKPIDPTQPNPFVQDLESANLPRYIFIEPNWGNMILGTYKGGNSQHPVDDITSGEKLIKFVYESIRASSCWNNSVLIIIYDEHGGFYDHCVPPTTVAPGDVPSKTSFDFTQLGVRVPAVIISPWIPKNLVDHTIYDHTTVLATLREWFQLLNLGDIGYFTERDMVANDLSHLFSLAAPRTDAPATLPDAANSGIALPAAQSIMSASEADFANFPEAGKLVESTQAGFVQVALKRHLENVPKSEQSAILQRVKRIKTVGEAKRYLRDVQTVLDAKAVVKKTATKRKAAKKAKGQPRKRK
jgi:phospholipase C